MDLALLLFGKIPRPGSVKTRLRPVLTPEEAGRLYRAFLHDAVQQALRMEAEVRLYLDPPIPDEERAGLSGDVPVRKQEGPSLGPRMEQAFRETLEEGFERVLLMGTDHPTLPLSFLRQGGKALRHSRSISVGPTEDGGFYLLGMNALYSELFTGMSYSHPQVFSETLARAERTDARVTVLPQWYDVDTPPDLERLISDLQSGQASAPSTTSMLDQLGLETLLS